MGSKKDKVVLFQKGLGLDFKGVAGASNPKPKISQQSKGPQIPPLKLITLPKPSVSVPSPLAMKVDQPVPVLKLYSVNKPSTPLSDIINSSQQDVKVNPQALQKQSSVDDGHQKRSKKDKKARDKKLEKKDKSEKEQKQSNSVSEGKQKDKKLESPGLSSIELFDMTEFEQPVDDYLAYFPLIGEPLKVVVATKLSSTEFYFRADSANDALRLQKLEDAMKNWYRNNHTIVEDKVHGDLKSNIFCAWWSDIGLCKRVKIVGAVDPNTRKVRVFLLDYGKFKVVPVAELYPLRRKYVIYSPVFSMLGKFNLQTLPPSQQNQVETKRRIILRASGFFDRPSISQTHPGLFMRETGVKLTFEPDLD